MILNEISKKIIGGKIKEGDRVEIEADGEKIIIS
jgi:hypothetical protein